MTNVAEGPAERVPWSEVRRYNVHRTSWLTNNAVRYLRDHVSVLRGSTHKTENSADLILYAALRRIMRGKHGSAERDAALRELADEVTAVLAGKYLPVSPREPHDPGE